MLHNQLPDILSRKIRIFTVTSNSLFLIFICVSQLSFTIIFAEIFKEQIPEHVSNHQNLAFDLANDGNSANKPNSDLHFDHDYFNPDQNQQTSSFLNNDFKHDPQSSLMTNRHRVPQKEYLVHHLADEACRLDRGCSRRDRLNNTYLGYCSRYKLENLLSNEILMSIMHDSSEQCDRILDEFIQLDEMIDQFDQLFKKVLSRYNCHNGYSVKWSCDDCKRAYKDWLCATNLPYYMNGERIKPCISFCERVEQRCPYLHPIAKEQYGGQPVFICRDPNIPFVPEITPDIPYSEPTKCYDLCHLSDNQTELINDSLSKYRYDKCPDKGSIAEEVRSDPLYCKLDGSNLTSNQDKFDTSTGFFNEEIGQNTGKQSTSTVTPTLLRSNPGSHVHIKKLNELKEVLTIYKSQPKIHSFGHHAPRAA